MINQNAHQHQPIILSTVADCSPNHFIQLPGRSAQAVDWIIIRLSAPVS